MVAVITDSSNEVAVRQGSNYPLYFKVHVMYSRTM